MTHHNITYIYCDQCDFKTKTKQSFNHHIKQNHDSSSKKHKCKYCDYESVRRDNVEEHQQSVHENVRYPCDQCGHQATRLQYLEKHMKTFHSEWYWHNGTFVYLVFLIFEKMRSSSLFIFLYIRIRNIFQLR